MSYSTPWYNHCKKGDKVESLVRKNAWSDSDLPFFKWLVTTHPKIGECHEIEQVFQFCHNPNATCQTYLKLKGFDYYRIATDFAPYGQSERYRSHKILRGGGDVGSILLQVSTSPTPSTFNQFAPRWVRQRVLSWICHHSHPQTIIAPFNLFWRNREGRCLPLSFPLFSQLFGHISNVFPFIHSLSFHTANYGSPSTVNKLSSEGTQAHDEHAHALAKRAQGRKGVKNV